MYIQMKKKKAFALIITMLLLVAFAAGCGDKVAKKPVEQEKPKAEQVAVKTDTPKSKNMVLNIDDSIPEKEQFRMLGDVTEGQMKPTSYLENNDSELNKAMETALNFVLVLNSVDYRTYSEEVGSRYLCQSSVSSEKRKKATQEFIKTIKKDQYVAQTVGVSWGNIAINSKKDKLMADYCPEVKVVSATSNYLKENSITKNKVYSTVGYLTMVKENGEWKVRSYKEMQIEDIAKKEAK